MTSPSLTVSAVATLALVTVLTPGNSVAVADQPRAPQVVESPKPKPSKPPRVTVDPSKEGVQAGAKGKVDGRLATSRPPRKSAPGPKRGTEESDNTHSPRRTKDSTSTNNPARVDFNLNIGICGRVQPDGTVPGPNWCQPVVPQETTAGRRRLPGVVVRARPQDVTWGQVLAESKVVLFPGLAVKVQPRGRTLVNLDTIVYTDESKVSTSTVTLLGFPVVVEATPISYSWNFGDGTPVLTTSTPGKPYPAKEITHKYMKRGAVSLTLTTSYAARFNVADTGWQYVDGTIPVSGPATPLQVREAVPVLVDPPN